MKIRTKYTISVIVLAVGTAMNIFKVEIQDNWVKLSLGILAIIGAGFGVKKIAEALKK